MSLLASLEDLFTARGEDPPVEEDHEAMIRAKLALEYASDLVRTYTGRTFDRIEDTVVLDGTGTQSLLLPNPPIAEVLSVITLDSQGEETEIDPADYRLAGSAGILRRIDGLNWPRGWQNIEVDLVSGYLLPGEPGDSGTDVPTLPQDIQGVVISIAGRQFDTAVTSGVTTGALTSVTMGVYSETYSDGSSSTVTVETGLTAMEAATLERYRLVRVA